MVRPKRVPTATIDYTKVTNVKELLDLIGKYIQQKVHGEALEHSDSELHGFLSKVIFSGGHKTNVFNKCDIDEQYETNVTDGHSYPCEGRSKNRFSYTEGAECDKSKIKGSNGKSEGACAPLRRLSLCDQNLEHIKPENIKDTHNLYIDVLLAAKYEGKMIAKKLEEYDPTNYESRICTELARSFADIGDIIRGKDLYLGYNRKEKAQKEKLEQNLKKFFQNIDEKLPLKAKNYYTKEKDPNFLKLREDWWTANRATIWEAITCGAPDYAQYFRGTCGSGRDATRTPSQCRCEGANANQVPTYFDYVPQYLRWFQEWAEDFCRKKKKKLENVKKQCRGDSGNQRYCSRNGYDCEKTKRAIGKYRMGNQCISCLYGCNPYVEWIDNQRKQFDKQKQKYINVINGAPVSGRQKRGARGSNSDNNGYEKIFYEKLKKSRYGSVNDFLEKLNNETDCQKVDDPEGGKIDFKTVNSGSASGDGNNKTFYRSEYCQPCPHCGVKKKENGEWEKKSDNEQCRIKLYRPKKGATPTDITILKSGEGEKDIAEKLEAFCEEKNGDTPNSNGNSVASGSAGRGRAGHGDEKKSDKDSLYEEWKCYEEQDIENDGQDDYVVDVNGSGGICILQKTNGDKNGKKQKTYNDFFNFWVAHVLKDSIHWRTKKINKCLKNGKAIKCTDKCKGDCDCFKRWVDQKKDEWGQIKTHFGKQKNLPLDPVSILEQVLEKGVLLTSIKEAYGDAKETEHIKQLLDEENEKNQVEEADGGTDSQKKNTIDKLLNHEDKDAETCKKTQEECEKKKQQQQQQEATRARGRSDDHQPPRSPGPTDDPTDHEVEEEEDDDDEDDEDGDDAPEEVKTEDAVDTTEELPRPSVTPVPELPGPPPPAGPDVCKIVGGILTKDKLQEACSTKYVNGHEKFPNWKCIPTEKTNAATSEGSGENGALLQRNKRDLTLSAPSGKDTGSICIPPRRRRLYVGKLHEWASGNTQVEGQVEAQSSSSETPSQPNSHPASPSNSRDGLLKAFVESAAVETFFLWHKYKEEKKREEKEKEEAENHLVVDTSYVANKLQNDLEGNGTIPEEFKRRMFYTLGDYRDICVGKTPDGIDTVSASGDNPNKKVTMKDISEKIKTAIEQSGEQPGGKPAPKPSVEKTTPTEWWKINGQHIWNGMICALTYEEKTSSASGSESKIEQNQKLKDALWDTEKKQPKNGNNYNSVELKEENDTEAKKATDSQHPQITKLTDFVSRPTFFRWLEEWGEEFCRKRTHKLYIIKKDCYKNGERCSGDGLNCKDTVPKKEDIFKYFNCSTCSRHCRYYKKWIERKKDEFDKQKDRYQTESENYDTNNYDNGFSAKLKETCTDAASFLEKLKDGPCKNNSEEDQKVNGYIKFDDHKTFGHETYCDPCSEFTVKCSGNNHCDKSKGNGCNGTTTITAKEIAKMRSSTPDVVMRVSDNDTNTFEGDDLKVCEGKGIFKGIKKDEWKCGKFCGVDICTLKKNVNNGKDEEHIIMKELVKRWLEYFFEDYNIIRKKLKACTKNGKGSTCIRSCVDEWIKLKKDEWKNINDNYLKQYTEKNPHGNNLTSFLEGGPFRSEVDKAIKPCDGLEKFQNSTDCTVAGSSEKESGKQDKKSDIIDCLLKKLEEKAKTCQSKHSGESPPNCDEKSTPDVEDDEEPEDLSLEEEQNPKNMRPGFCPQNDTTEEPVDEDTCKPEGIVKEEEEEKEEEKDKGDEADQESSSQEVPEEAIPEKKVPAPLPPPPPPLPPLKTALVSSTLAWSVGIGFATFTYFYLKVLYICGCGCICICVFLCGYVCRGVFGYIYGCICVLWIYIYIC